MPSASAGDFQASDFLTRLPQDVLLYVCSFLPAFSIPHVLSTSKHARSTVDGSNFLFLSLCQQAWDAKVYVPECIRLVALGDEGMAEHRRNRKEEIKTSSSVKDLKIKLLRAGVSSAEIAGEPPPRELGERPRRLRSSSPVLAALASSPRAARRFLRRLVFESP